MASEVVSGTFQSWKCMLSRCAGYDPHHRQFYAGIKVCKRWRRFENFLADMGERPTGTTLERVKGSIGYRPGNCRWASWEEQANNRSSNRNLTAFGKTQSITRWARERNIARRTLASRLDRNWPIEIALTFPATIGNNQTHGGWHAKTDATSFPTS